MSGETLRVLEATDAGDRQEWIRLWEDSSERLPYAHPGVAGPLGQGDGRLLALTMSGSEASVLYPVVLRDAGLGMRDLTSPYGYGGALVHGDGVRRGIAERFWVEADRWARDERVVSEFTRMSLFPDTLPTPGRVRRRGLNFVRDLPTDPAAVIEGCVPKVRQNVRKATRSGLTVRITEDDSLSDDFERIYLATMSRVGSDSWYRFDHEFFATLHAGFGTGVAYVAVEEEGRPVSMDLLLLGRETAYYFLGGTDMGAARSRPNDLVKVAVMEWLVGRGYRRYVLGGGVRAGDGLERYKRGFAPAGGISFCTAERIVDPGGYSRLVAVRRTEALDLGAEWDGDGEFFPVYRTPLRQPEPELATTGSGRRHD